MSEMDTAPPANTATETRLNPKWWVKIAIFSVVLVGFGLWGYYDATVVYPRRGREASLGLERSYLDAVQRTNPRNFNDAASIADPAKELATPPPAKSAETEVDTTRREWLKSLATVKMADPAHTTYPRVDTITGTEVKDARDRLSELDKLSTEKYQNGFPKALSAFDIPTQWLIMAVGLIGGVWTAVVILRAKMQKYRWEPGEQRLTLPGGTSIVPADIVEFDKRKWDKFIITLKIRDGHPQLSGKPLTIDLYPHDPLESWILEMERTVFPDSEIAPG